MSQDERTGQRDLRYSRWHRSGSLKRYIGYERAFNCAMIDIDAVEYCQHCKTPLALIETQHSHGPPKEANVMARLANLAGLHAFSLSYTCDSHGDLLEIRARLIAPTRGPVRTFTPTEWAHVLDSIRQRHYTQVGHRPPPPAAPNGQLQRLEPQPEVPTLFR
jgi:hypothetical protein